MIERERQEKVVKRKRDGPRDASVRMKTAAKKAKWAIIIIDPYFPLSIYPFRLPKLVYMKWDPVCDPLSIKLTL